MKAFELIKYGARACYWLTVEGIDCVWSESPISLALPASYTQHSPTLSIDGSSEVGSRVRGGIGSGLPLSFLLLDAPEASISAASFFRAPSRFFRLTSNLEPGDTSAAVADSSAASPGDVLYVGNERIQVGSVPDGVTLAGLTRGTATAAAAGSFGYASRHLAEGSGSHITSHPTDWRGREVRLFVLPQAPDGFQPGANLADHSVEVFRGYISGRPVRDSIGAFSFDCLCLDRKLATALPPLISGRIDSKTGFRTVQPHDRLELRISYKTPSGDFKLAVVVSDPYKDLASPYVAHKTHAEIRKDLTAGFTAAIANANSGGQVHPVSSVSFAKDSAGGMWQCLILFDPSEVASGQILQIESMGTTTIKVNSIAVSWTTDWASVAYTFISDPFLLSKEEKPPPFSTLPPTTIGFIPDSGDVADVPTSGALHFKGKIYTYSGVFTSSSIAYLSNATPTPTAEDYQEWDGETAEIIQSDSGLLADVFRRAVCSHVGSGQRSAVFDTLATGYGIHESAIDLDSFQEVLGGTLGSFGIHVALSGASVSSIFGGLLQLSDRAIVCRDDGTGRQRLAVVRVSPSGAETAFSLVDADLLIGENEPIESELLETPNQVKITLKNGLEGDNKSLIYRHDAARVRSQGLESLDVSIPIADPSVANDLASVYSGALFSRDQRVALYALRVAPWGVGNAQPGDLIQMDLSHPAAWNYATASAGCSTVARVIGREFSLQDCSVTLTVVSAGASALCPAAAVVAFDSAAAPTRIDVDKKYLLHFSTALEKHGTRITLLHFEPGTNETTGEGYKVSSAVESGGVCRLAVTNLIGSPVLSADSFLTLPTSLDASISAYQLTFAHKDDGGSWL